MVSKLTGFSVRECLNIKMWHNSDSYFKFLVGCNILYYIVSWQTKNVLSLKKFDNSPKKSVLIIILTT